MPDQASATRAADPSDYVPSESASVDDLDADEWSDWFERLPEDYRVEYRNHLILSGLRAGLTLQAVGDRYGVSRERIRQIALAQGVTMRELRAEQKLQAERHYRRIARRVYGTSLSFPELEISEIAEWWDTDEKTVRRALEHRLAVHEVVRNEWTTGIGDQDLLAALAQWGSQTEAVTGDAFTEWAKERGIPGKQTVSIRFGGWNTALVLAGLSEHVVDRGGLRPQIEDETLWASVYQFFRSDSPGFSFQHYDEFARDHGLASGASVRNRLGSWSSIKMRVRELLRYAADRDGSWKWGDQVLDIVPGEVRRNLWNHDECVAALQRIAARVDGPLTVQQYNAARNSEDPSSNAIQMRCGSWVEALLAAGLDGRLSARGRRKLAATLEPTSGAWPTP